MLLTVLFFFFTITTEVHFVEGLELKTCASGLTCIPLSRCAYWCRELHSKQVNQNLELRAILKKETCHINIKGEASVCCEEDTENVDRCLRCGRVQTLNDLRCIDCESSLPGQWPWMARLLYRNQKAGDTYCGGVLISVRYALTAAHCINEDGPERIVLGENDVTREYDCLSDDCGSVDGTEECFKTGFCADPVVSIEVSEITKHPDYDETVPANDVALLKLKTIVQFTSFIQPICLPQLKRLPLEGEDLVMSGWGNTQNLLRKASDVLQYVGVGEVDYEECSKTWRKELPSSTLCVSTRKPGSSPCVGDSGGPLVRIADREFNQFELIGIVSFGPSVCGNTEFPVGTTRIDGDILSWIKENVQGGLLTI